MSVLPKQSSSVMAPKESVSRPRFQNSSNLVRKTMPLQVKNIESVIAEIERETRTVRKKVITELEMQRRLKSRCRPPTKAELRRKVLQNKVFSARAEVASLSGKLENFKREIQKCRDFLDCECGKFSNDRPVNCGKCAEMLGPLAKIEKQVIEFLKNEFGSKTKSTDSEHSSGPYVRTLTGSETSVVKFSNFRLKKMQNQTKKTSFSCLKPLLNKEVGIIAQDISMLSGNPNDKSYSMTRIDAPPENPPPELRRLKTHAPEESDRKKMNRSQLHSPSEISIPWIAIQSNFDPNPRPNLYPNIPRHSKGSILNNHTDPRLLVRNSLDSQACQANSVFSRLIINSNKSQYSKSISKFEDAASSSPSKRLRWRHQLQDSPRHSDITNDLIIDESSSRCLSSYSSQKIISSRITHNTAIFEEFKIPTLIETFEKL